MTFFQTKYAVSTQGPHGNEFLSLWGAFVASWRDTVCAGYIQLQVVKGIFIACNVASYSAHTHTPSIDIHQDKLETSSWTLIPSQTCNNAIAAFENTNMNAAASAAGRYIAKGLLSTQHSVSFIRNEAKMRLVRFLAIFVGVIVVSMTSQRHCY